MVGAGGELSVGGGDSEGGREAGGSRVDSAGAGETSKGDGFRGDASLGAGEMGEDIPDRVGVLDGGSSGDSTGARLIGKGDCISCVMTDDKPGERGMGEGSGVGVGGVIGEGDCNGGFVGTETAD